MKKRVRVIKICSLVTVIAFGLSVGYLIGRPKNVNAQIDSDMQGIMRDINKVMENRSDTALSSNPYDYIENSEGYRDIIDIGIPALPALLSRMENNPDKGGLEQYIMAIAVEDIGGVQLRDLGYQWSTGAEWQKAFLEFKAMLGQDFEKLSAQKSLSVVEKVAKLNKYGLFAIPYQLKLGLSESGLNETELKILTGITD